MALVLLEQGRSIPFGALVRWPASSFHAGKVRITCHDMPLSGPICYVRSQFQKTEHRQIQEEHHPVIPTIFVSKLDPFLFCWTAWNFPSHVLCMFFLLEGGSARRFLDLSRVSHAGGRWWALRIRLIQASVPWPPRWPLREAVSMSPGNPKPRL